MLFNDYRCFNKKVIQYKPDEPTTLQKDHKKINFKYHLGFIILLDLFLT